MNIIRRPFPNVLLNLPTAKPFRRLHRREFVRIRLSVRGVEVCVRTGFGLVFIDFEQVASAVLRKAPGSSYGYGYPYGDIRTPTDKHPYPHVRNMPPAATALAWRPPRPSPSPLGQAAPAGTSRRPRRGAFGSPRSRKQMPSTN